MQKKMSKLVVKDSKGKVVQLLPEPAMDYEIVAESSRPVSNSVVASTLLRMENEIVSAMHLDTVTSEPTVQSTSGLGGNSFISWLQKVSWTFTIDTEGAGSGSRSGQIPFCLYGLDNVSITIDWGDGTVEEYSSEEAVANSCPTHVYDIADEYAVTVSSYDFSRIYLWTDTEATGRPATWMSTLKSVDMPLPALAGVHALHWNEDQNQNAVENVDGSLESCFSGCTNLEYVLPEVFANNADVTSLTKAFKGCTSLDEIPYDIFNNIVAIEDLSECFSGCTGLTKIDEELFSDLIHLKNLSGCFLNCTQLKSIPKNLFAKNTSIIDFSNCFDGCNALNDFDIIINSQIIEDTSAFVSYKENSSRNIEVIYLSETYASFNLIANSLGLNLKLKLNTWTITIDTEGHGEGEKTGQIPFIIRGDDTNNYVLTINWGDGTSEICNSLETINYWYPTHLYEEAGEYTIQIESLDFEHLSIGTLFWDEGYPTGPNIFTDTLKSINSPLPKIKGVYDSYYGKNFSYKFDNMFSMCYKLESIPSNLFEYNPDVTSFYGCFLYTSLQSIPSDLFIHNQHATNFNSCFQGCSFVTSIPINLFANNLNATTFNSCFYQCYSITSIPGALFEHNTNATDFSGCFDDCTDCQSIPSNLFEHNTKVTNIQYCFSQCTSLTSIPSGLFDNNTAVTSFASCFSGCTSLTSIPSGLFDNNVLATDFSYCFQGCSSLTTIPSGLFDNNTQAIYFSNTFSRCSNLQSIPEMLFKYNIAVTTVYYCFNNCSSLGAFNLHIGSSIINTVTNFVTKNTNVVRTIYVPENSTTYTRFNNVASTLGLTIVQE